MATEADANVHEQVQQSVMVTPIEAQVFTLMTIVQQQQQMDDFKVLVFFPTARMTQLMTGIFQRLGLKVFEIHARKSQAKRDRVSSDFRLRRNVVLFTSDVSARGMDYPDVTCVIQVGLPNNQVLLACVN